MKTILLVLVDERTVEFVDPHNVDVLEAAEPIDLRKIPKAERADAKLVKQALARLDEVDALEERLLHILRGELGTRPFRWYDGTEGEGFNLFEKAQYESED